MAHKENHPDKPRYPKQDHTEVRSDDFPQACPEPPLTYERKYSFYGQQYDLHEKLEDWEKEQPQPKHSSFVPFLGPVKIRQFDDHQDEVNKIFNL